ncbi:MAG: hypothetical protein ACLFV2_00430 [Desulfurivibrionaceae bacterium]
MINSAEKVTLLSILANLLLVSVKAFLALAETMAELDIKALNSRREK